MQADMQFENAQQAAVRMGVTVRAIQKWATEGRLPGAEKVGRQWLIPVGIEKPIDKSEVAEVSQKKLRIPMPLLNSAFPIGKCREYIESIADKDDKAIALGEYYYFSGQAEFAAKTVEQYLDSEDESLRFSAGLICSFANLSRGHIHLARFALGKVKESLYKGLMSTNTEAHAIGVFTATAATVLLHLPVTDVPPLEDYLRYLPEGLKIYACYVLAHKAYLEENYEGCLATAGMALALSPNRYPIAEIYCRLVSVMALMSLKRTDEAKRQMAAAWETAKPDDLIEGFGEHHGLLHGMIEIFFKKDYPEDFKRIIDITYSFSAGWRKIHNPDAQHDVADNLSTTEFTVAMLYNRNWEAKEIAAHMGLTEHTIRNHISNIFDKLNINDKSQLSAFMLK